MKRTQIETSVEAITERSQIPNSVLLKVEGMARAVSHRDSFAKICRTLFSRSRSSFTSTNSLRNRASATSVSFSAFHPSPTVLSFPLHKARTLLPRLLSVLTGASQPHPPTVLPLPPVSPLPPEIPACKSPSVSVPSSSSVSNHFTKRWTPLFLAYLANADSI